MAQDQPPGAVCWIDHSAVSSANPDGRLELPDQMEQEEARGDWADILS